MLQVHGIGVFISKFFMSHTSLPFLLEVFILASLSFGLVFIFDLGQRAGLEKFHGGVIIP